MIIEGYRSLPINEGAPNLATCNNCKEFKDINTLGFLLLVKVLQSKAMGL